jgi:hypothetical protein
VPSAPFVVPPLLLIAILLVSAMAKIRDPRDTTTVFDKLRLPAFLLTLKAPRLLPYAELVLAALLLVLPDGWYVVATSLALLLFACYLVVVVRALTFGYPIMCGCFGKLGLGWITRRTAVRNAVLLAVAVIAWLDSWQGDGVLQRLTDLGTDGWWLAGLAVAVVTTAFVVRESDIPVWVPDADEYVTRPVPYLVLDGPEGPGSVWQLSDTAARLLVFWDPADAETAALADRLSAWQQELRPVRAHLVAQSEWSTVAKARPDLADHLLGDPEGITQQRLGVHRVPGAVIVGTDRLLAGGPVMGVDEIEELVAAAAEEIQAAAAVPPDAAPAP